jgi:hypothetical protein
MGFGTLNRQTSEKIQPIPCKMPSTHLRKWSQPIGSASSCSNIQHQQPANINQQPNNRGSDHSLQHHLETPTVPLSSFSYKPRATSPLAANHRKPRLEKHMEITPVCLEGSE